MMKLVNFGEAQRIRHCVTAIHSLIKVKGTVLIPGIRKNIFYDSLPGSFKPEHAATETNEEARN